MLDLPETLCYPRPLQEHLPLVVGGGGERRTLRLAVRYADAANVMGGLDVVRRKAGALRASFHLYTTEADVDAALDALVG